jgi:hypothetical protein
MKLMQSICCFFSSRCANEAPEAKKADRDASAGETRRTAGQKSPRRATRETKDSRSGQVTN